MRYCAVKRMHIRPKERGNRSYPPAAIILADIQLDKVDRGRPSHDAVEDIAAPMLRRPRVGPENPDRRCHAELAQLKYSADKRRGAGRNPRERHFAMAKISALFCNWRSSAQQRDRTYRSPETAAKCVRADGYGAPDRTAPKTNPMTFL